MTSLQILFVPYALRKQDEYAATARKAFEAWGFSFSSIHTAENPYLAASQAQVKKLVLMTRLSSLITLLKRRLSNDELMF